MRIQNTKYSDNEKTQYPSLYVKRTQAAIFCPADTGRAPDVKISMNLGGKTASALFSANLEFKLNFIAEINDKPGRHRVSCRKRKEIK